MGIAGASAREASIAEKNKEENRGRLGSLAVTERIKGCLEGEEPVNCHHLGAGTVEEEGEVRRARRPAWALLCSHRCMPREVALSGRQRPILQVSEKCWL